MSDSAASVSLDVQEADRTCNRCSTENSSRGLDDVVTHANCHSTPSSTPASSRGPDIDKIPTSCSLYCVPGLIPAEKPIDHTYSASVAVDVLSSCQEIQPFHSPQGSLLHQKDNTISDQMLKKPISISTELSDDDDDGGEEENEQLRTCMDSNTSAAEAHSTVNPSPNFQHFSPSSSPLPQTFSSSSCSPSIPPLHPRPSSPYVMIEGRCHPVLNTSSFESTGLLYAHDNVVHVDSEDLNTESATDVLWEEDENDEIKEEDRRDFDEDTGSSNDISVSQSSDELLNSTQQITHESEMIPPVDPSVLLDLEVLSAKLGRDHAHMMDNLRTSLHAMSVCTHQGISLQRETIENMQQTVDFNVKAMYSFLSKFSELHRNLKPMQDIGRQIHEVNELLKVLERLF